MARGSGQRPHAQTSFRLASFRLALDRRTLVKGALASSAGLAATSLVDAFVSCRRVRPGRACQAAIDNEWDKECANSSL